MGYSTSGEQKEPKNIQNGKELAKLWLFSHKMLFLHEFNYISVISCPIWMFLSSFCAY